MQSDEGTAHRPQQQRLHYSRSRQALEVEEQPSQDDANSMRKGRPGKGPNTGVIVIPHIPRVPPSRAMFVEDPPVSRPASIVHPYVSGALAATVSCWNGMNYTD